MHIKDILSDKEKGGLLIFKTDWYINVYKKTEKITAASFFVTDSIKDDEYKKDIVSDIRTSAKDMLRTTIALVANRGPVGGEEMQSLVRHTSMLRSMFVIAATLHIVRQDLVDVLIREIDGVLQNIHLLGDELRAVESASLEAPPLYVHDERKRTVRSSVSLPKEVHKERVKEEGGVTQGGAARRDGILKVIRERGVVSIKDISDSIKDCSEKTIQRELMDMIKDEMITKTGERRWSRYALKSA